MNENIKKFLEKVAADKELQGQLSKIRDPHEAYTLAAGVQDGFTEEEFVDEMKKLYAEVTKDLSEEDMAKLAGGMSEWGKDLLIVGTVSASQILLSLGGCAAYAAVT